MNERKRTRLLAHFKSIQSAIFAAVSILVLSAVVIVTAVSLHYTKKSIFDNSALYTRTIISQMNQNIDSYIDYMENIAYMIAYGKDAQNYLFTEMPVEEAAYGERLREQFRIILKSRNDIKNIGIIQKDGRFLFNDGYKVINPNVDVSSLGWYRDVMEKEGDSLLTSSHVQHVIKGERPWVITLSRAIHNFGGSGGKEGVVFLDLNYSAISELCDQNTIDSKGYVFILDQDGNIVYHPQQQQLYNELQTESIDKLMKAETDTITVGTGDNAKIYTLSRSEKTGWTVVGCMNMAELVKDSRKAQSMYVIIAIALVIISLLFSSLIARNITLPIQKLRDSMAKVQTGDFSAASVDIYSRNEIGSLTRSFNVMTHRIEELMAQNVHEQEEKRKSELKALQSQINPHFLYNTLDSIIWMAEGKKNEEVVLMTASLARLLRQSISNEDEVVPVRQEIEYIRSYLTIQKMRYKDKLEFTIDVDPAINYVTIIKLVLQPIIENAIYHGLKYKESKGMLLVRGYEEGENAVLEITDNGVGMEPEVLEHIFEKHKVNYRSNGVGVYNVQKRLKLYYGNDYGITYKSSKGVGTTAIIKIPKKQEAAHEKI